MATALLPLIAAAAPETAAAIGASSTFAALPSFGSLLSFGSAVSSISGGLQGNAIAKAQARQYELSARQEELKGREQADKIRRALQATLATQNATFAARGISLSSGTPVNLGNVSRTEAARDIEIAQFGASASAAAERSRAAQSKIQGRTSLTSGFSNAGLGLAGKYGSLLS